MMMVVEDRHTLLELLWQGGLFLTNHNNKIFFRATMTATITAQSIIYAIFADAATDIIASTIASTTNRFIKVKIHIFVLVVFCHSSIF
mmetsp:Transcript_9826/g.13832  ORF Transcript_9826/g.13832 Transcript_9826/m.13832 type:complete len:88 (-) Transcript_9826:33-296(-)